MTPVRKVRADAHGAWACYAETGGMCHKTRMPGRVCPCDGWVPFLTSWRSLADAIECEISDDEYDRLKTWLAEWRAS